MKTFKSILAIASAHLSKILVGFILLKFISYNLGAEGLGFLGNFMSMVTLMGLLAGGGVVTGIVKYVSQYRREPKRMISFVNSAAFYSLGISFLILILGSLFSKNISIAIFNTDSYSHLIIILSFAQLFMAFSNVVIGVCNGLKDNKTYAKIQLYGNFLFLPLAWVLITQYYTFGAAAAIILVFVGSFFSCWYFYKKSFFKNKINIKNIRTDDFSKLFKYTIMMSVSAIAFPIVEIYVRNIIIAEAGYSDAGIWQASMKLAAAYLGFFSMFLAYYFMPMISADENIDRIKKLAYKYVIIIMSIFFAAAVVLYFLKSTLIPIMLSNDFTRLEDFLIYQLVGDFFKISSYVFGYVAVAKAATKIYIMAEILQSLLFISCIALISGYGALKNVMFGYAISNFLYFMISLSIFFFYTKKKLR